jgi:hypothetical protein
MWIFGKLSLIAKYDVMDEQLEEILVWLGIICMCIAAISALVIIGQIVYYLLTFK